MAEPVVAPLLGFALVCAALDPLLPAAAAALAWANGWLAVYLAWCARTVGSLPGAQIGSGWAIAAFLVMGLLIVVLLRLPRPARRRVAMLAAVAVALAAGGWIAWPQHVPAPPDGLRITFLDVGQGDAALLQVREGAMLVDQGPPEADVAEQLEDLGVSSVSVLVLTHPHRDHVGGAAEALDALRVTLVLSPLQPTESSDEHAALAEAKEEHVPVVAARVGEVYRLGRLRLRVLWPDEAGSPSAHPHDHAVVVLASYGEFDALLTADAESDVTLPLRPPPVELLKVAHHGSDDPGLRDLLSLVRPRIAVISVGRSNDYGHPTPETLAALATAPGLDVRRTDEDGRVVVETDGARYTVREER
jgi:competence protein ComEC